MHASKESTPSVVPTVRPPYWSGLPLSGPAELYRAFAFTALDEFLATQNEIDDEQMALIARSVEVAVGVALRAAGVSDSWLPMYRAAEGRLA